MGRHRPGEHQVTHQANQHELPDMHADTPWTLTLAGHPPVPVTVDRVEGQTTHYRTPVMLPLGPPGQHVTVRATLTAPDGSEQTGIGSIDGITWHTDRTTSMDVSFTAT